uniref:Uncharacterized protein n=1 Tax=virus sp. ctML55 TaxID=2827627 RepID=A0A8S5RJ41_9VIRU|nr:MAG TPA: hypothetical protein [virus sp. ctML55]DAW92045.1 MAG TPA: hypothetical protein [Bacteriophage sp.]
MSSYYIFRNILLFFFSLLSNILASRQKIT